jgi:hypothetical protein
MADVFKQNHKPTHNSFVFFGENNKISFFSVLNCGPVPLVSFRFGAKQKFLIRKYDTQTRTKTEF